MMTRQISYIIKLYIKQIQLLMNTFCKISRKLGQYFLNFEFCLKSTDSWCDIINDVGMFIWLLNLHAKLACVNAMCKVTNSRRLVHFYVQNYYEKLTVGEGKGSFPIILIPMIIWNKASPLSSLTKQQEYGGHKPKKCLEKLTPHA